MTAAATALQTAPRLITVRPAPRREPPFDDEVAPRHLYAVGPLDRPLPFENPTSRLRSLQVVPPIADPALPDPARWARRLLIALSETAAGRRPLQQLAALLSPSVAYGLSGDFELAARQRRRHWMHAGTVRTVRASQPADGVAELSATVEVDGRVRAIALRLEVHRGRWRCTRMQLG